MVKQKRRVHKRWEFLWRPVGQMPSETGHLWKSKVFRVATFQGAMDRMLDYLLAKPFECVVDYEAKALHIRYRPERHDEAFPRIDYAEHELAEYVD